MPEDRFRARLDAARSAVLATVTQSATPHQVPIVFAVSGDRLVTAVDHKPKTTRALRRLSNIVANPCVSVLVDEYTDDWNQLWWVRIDGTASVVESGPTFASGLDLLVAKYEQYRTNRPDGPLIDISIDRISGWEAASGV